MAKLKTPTLVAFITHILLLSAALGTGANHTGHNHRCPSGACPQIKLYAKSGGWLKLLKETDPLGVEADGGKGSNDYVLNGPIEQRGSGWRLIPAPPGEGAPSAAKNEPQPPTLESSHEFELYLECTAPYPIQWAYKGDGWDLNTKNPRHQLKIEYNTQTSGGVGNKNATYQGTISGLHLYEKVTGQYICQSLAVQPSKLECVDDKKESSSIYLFVPYNAPEPNVAAAAAAGNSPINTFLKYEPGSTTQLILAEPATADGKVSELVIPCSVSDPTADVTLYKIYDDGDEEQLELDFDPKAGFVLSTAANAPSALWGKYVCKISRESKTVTFQVVGGPGRVKRSPRESAHLNPSSIAPEDSPPPNIQLAFVHPTSADFQHISEDGSSPNYSKEHSGYRFTVNDFQPEEVALYLQCRGHYPIEWSYEGAFAPKLISTSQRYLPNMEAPATEYFFITELIIQDFSVEYTGEFVCEKVSDNEAAGEAKTAKVTPTRRDKNTSSAVYLFFADPAALFLPQPPSQTAQVEYGVIQGFGDATFKRRFPVPCPISDPLRVVTLWYEEPVKKSWAMWPNPDQLKYDPKTGFEVYPEFNPVGAYECLADGDDDEHSGQVSRRVNVISKIETGNRISRYSFSPATSSLAIGPPRLVTLTCEASQSPVTLIFSDPDLKGKDTWVTSSNFSGSPAFQYLTSVTIDTATLAPTGYYTVGCVQRDKNGTLYALHSWSLSDEQGLKPYAATPPGSKIHLFPSRVIVLVCETHEPATLVISDPALAKSSVRSSNSTGNTTFKYSALAVVDTRGKSGFFTVACVKSADINFIWHSWRLSNEDDSVDPLEGTAPDFIVSPPEAKIQLQLQPSRVLEFSCESEEPVTLLTLPSPGRRSLPASAQLIESRGTALPYSASLIIDSVELEELGLSAISCLTKGAAPKRILHRWQLELANQDGAAMPDAASSSFALTPADAHIPISPPRVQLLVCEAHEEITLQFSDPTLISSLVISKNATGKTEFKYSALAILETPRITTNFSTIDCVQVRNGGAKLHRWHLTDIKPGQVTTFTYDKPTNLYLCCSNGYLRPQLSLVEGCHSITECRLRACLQNKKCVQTLGNGLGQPEVQPGQGDPEEDLPRCSTLNAQELSQTDGMLLCDLGVKAAAGAGPTFSYLLFYRDLESDSEVHTTNWDLTSNFGASATFPEAFLKIDRILIGRDLNPRIKKFICHGSKFFFSLGFYWELEYESGGRERVKGADKMTRNSIYKSTLQLEAQELDNVKRIHCFAPEWSSYSWRNVSLAI